MNRREFNRLMGLGAATAVTTSLFTGKASAASSLERIKSSGVLRVGAIADGAPNYQKSIADGSWRGFYVDLYRKLAEDLGVELQILETTWGNAVLDLQADKTDVFFGLNRTPEREKVIDFSVPVFRSAFTMTVKGINATTWEEFNNPNVRIAIDAGSAHDSLVSRLTPNAQIIRLKTVSDATAAVQAGRADAQCLTLIIALSLRAKNPSTGDVVIPEPIEFTTSHAGFRREEDKSWQEFVNNWINEQRENGFVKEAIIRNMTLVGIKESDLPPNFQF